MTQAHTSRLPIRELADTAIQRALDRGAIVPLRTETMALSRDGVTYLVKSISSLSLKDMAAQRPKACGNPFLPYDQDLFVADLSPTHVLLLNKFPIESRHLLAATRTFVPQTAPLAPEDFQAVALLLHEAKGHAAYNGGKEGGASQPHRHFHFLLNETEQPLEALYPKNGVVGRIGQVPHFNFVHAFIRLDEAISEVTALARHLQQAFEDGCRHCAISPAAGELPPYNLLATRRWMLIVPRSKEHWSSAGEAVSLNAFSYLGILAVREQRQIALMEAAGLWSILEAVSVPK